MWAKNGKWVDAGAVGTSLQEAFFLHPQPNGIRLHVVDILSEELFAAGQDTLTTEAILLILEPLLAEIGSTEDKAFFSRAVKNLISDLPRSAPSCRLVRILFTTGAASHLPALNFFPAFVG